MKYLDTRASCLKSLFILFTFLSFLFASVRIYKRCRSRKFAADDIFVLATLGTLIAYTTTMLSSISNGIGSLPTDVDDPYTLSTGLKFWFIAELLYIVNSTLLRLAACIHLRKIVKGATFGWIILGVMGITSLYNALFFIVVLLQCTPIPSFWTMWVGGRGSCMDPEVIANMGYGFAGLGGVTSFGFVMAPVWLMWGTKLNQVLTKTTRAVMCTEFLAGLAMLLRIPATRMLLTSDDFFFDCVLTAVSSILEVGLGIIALSAAALLPIHTSILADGTTSAKNDSKLDARPTDEKQLDKIGKDKKIGDLALHTGSQVSPRNSVLRKLSEERTKQIA